MDKLKIVETVLKAVTALIAAILYGIKFLGLLGKVRPQTA
jgi:hypothetical protein